MICLNFVDDFIVRGPNLVQWFRSIWNNIGNWHDQLVLSDLWHQISTFGDSFETAKHWSIWLWSILNMRWINLLMQFNSLRNIVTLFNLIFLYHSNGQHTRICNKTIWRTNESISIFIIVVNNQNFQFYTNIKSEMRTDGWPDSFMRHMTLHKLEWKDYFKTCASVHNQIFSNIMGRACVWMCVSAGLQDLGIGNMDVLTCTNPQVARMRLPVNWTIYSGATHFLFLHFFCCSHKM